MSKMSQLDYEINELLDTTHLLCQEIADALACPLDMVETIVQQRFVEAFGIDEAEEIELMRQHQQMAYDADAQYYGA